MPRTTVSILKFVGTVSLGLLTGTSYAAATQSIPALLALPSASHAQTSFTQHRTHTIRHLDRLLATAIASYGVAFALSPRHLRHPYLLWCSLVALVGWEAATWMWKSAGGDAGLGIGGAPGRKAVASAREEEDGYVDATNSVSMSDSAFGLGTDSVMVNGEEVRRGMEKWKAVEAWRAGISGLAFLMGVIGIWGDGLNTSVAVVGGRA